VRHWSAPLDGDPIALFAAMRRASPVPFGAYVEDAEWAVLARTMERFLRYEARDRSIETRPIKGTIARAGDDASEARALASDDKERAEHAMIVDLMRNDLGRIAEIGSVRAENVMDVEPYAGLSHLVSTVRATVRGGLDLPEILGATFPPGSITGTPKLRAMELIEALERAQRGVAFGAIGHVDRAGGMSLAVAIRTATVEGGRAWYAAGGGLVEASQITREIAETELKARVFHDAIEALSC
jgi:para-aminobenzoate synthetase component 1